MSATYVCWFYTQSFCVSVLITSFQELSDALLMLQSQFCLPSRTVQLTSLFLQRVRKMGDPNDSAAGGWFGSVGSYISKSLYW